MAADIRSRCAIHSADKGTIMVIPRENKLVRIYCQLSELGPGIGGRIDRSNVTPERILKAARNILYPYKFEYKHCAWWTSYQVRQYQRIFKLFDSHPSILSRLAKELELSLQFTTGFFSPAMQFIRILPKPDRA